MSTPAGVVHTVRWQEICPWLLLVRAARVALMVRVIVLAMLGMWAVHLGWQVVDAVVTHPDPGPSFAELTAPAPLFATKPPVLEFSDPPPRGQLYVPLAERPWVGPLARAWAWAIQPLTRLVAAEGWRQLIGFLLAGTWTIAVWALFGGAIARIAALYLTRGETIGPIEALRAAVTRWTSTAGAPTFSFCLIVGAGVPLWIAGLLMRLDFLAAVGGALWFVALAFGALAAGLALLHLIGVPFMWATAAVERTDAFDALSRAWAYGFSRPLHLTFYVAVASLLGLLAETLVVLLVNWLVAGAEFGVAWGAGAARMQQLAAVAADTETDAGAMLTIAAAGMQFWSNVLLAAGSAFAIGYFWSAGVGLYLLMRRLVDATETNEIAFDANAPEPRVPQLTDDPVTGVPQAEPTPEAAAAPEQPSAEPPSE